MKKPVLILAISALSLIISNQASAQLGLGGNLSAGVGATVRTVGSDLGTDVKTRVSTRVRTVGNAKIYSDRDIISNTAQVKQYSAFSSAVEASGLESTLKAKGEFTVFVPTNQAFEKLSSEDKAYYLKSSDKAHLSTMLKYHILEGNISSGDIAMAITKGNGTATYTTLSGDVLTASLNSKKNIELTDENGNVALITAFDVKQSNGTIHEINNVMTPKK